MMKLRFIAGVPFRKEPEAADIPPERGIDSAAAPVFRGGWEMGICAGKA